MRLRLAHLLLVALVTVAVSGCCTKYQIDLQLRPSSMNQVFLVELMLLKNEEVAELGFVTDDPNTEDEVLKTRIASWLQGAEARQATFRELLIAQERLVTISDVSLPRESDKVVVLARELAKVSEETPVAIIAVAMFPARTGVANHFVRITVGDACKYTLVIDKDSVNYGLAKD